jgi:hypothetical protein
MATVVAVSPNGRSNTASSDVTSNRKRRSVRFGPSVEHVFERDFTQEDVHHIWYNGEEFNAIKSEIYAMMRSVNPCNRRLVQEHDIDFDPDHQYHWRGFEHVRQKRPRKEIRQRHASALLYFNRRMRGKDPTGLGSFAMSSSSDCLERARQLAIMDESEAMAIYKEADDDETQSQTSTTDDSSVASAAATTPEEVDSAYPVHVVTIGRHGGDECSKTTYLLHDHHVLSPQVAPMQDNPALSLLLVTYKLVITLFPCLC